MIHTITVCTGTSDYRVAAQEHAKHFAGWFDARLCVVAVIEPEDSAAISASGEDPDRLMEAEAQRVIQRIQPAGLHAVSHYRGEGVIDGLLAEAKESDLLILGMPTEAAADSDPVAAAMLHNGLPLLRGAECSLLIVAEPPRNLNRVLVNYQGGIAGKAALRMAGELAELTSAELVVLSIQRDLPLAAMLIGTAEEYLKGFRLTSVKCIADKDSPDSESDILDFAHSEEAGIIILGEEPYGFWHRIMGQATAEEVALATRIPVLIAR